MALIRSAPVTTAFAAPVVPSAIHNSMAFSFVCRNESFEPSGENLICEIFGCGGMVTFTSLPSAIFLRAIA